jgi:hypothetical protein
MQIHGCRGWVPFFPLANSGWVIRQDGAAELISNRMTRFITMQETRPRHGNGRAEARWKNDVAAWALLSGPSLTLTECCRYCSQIHHRESGFAALRF